MGSEERARRAHRFGSPAKGHLGKARSSIMSWKSCRDWSAEKSLGVHGAVAPRDGPAQCVDGLRHVVLAPDAIAVRWRPGGLVEQVDAKIVGRCPHEFVEGGSVGHRRQERACLLRRCVRLGDPSGRTQRVADVEEGGRQVPTVLHVGGVGVDQELQDPARCSNSASASVG